MQNLIFRLEDERGNELADAGINFADVVLELWEINDYKSTYPWLSSIDPYGYTVFNVHQIPNVIKELQKLSDTVTVQGFDKKIEQIVQFLQKIDQHRYIRFVGD